MKARIVAAEKSSSRPRAKSSSSPLTTASATLLVMTMLLLTVDDRAVCLQQEIVVGGASAVVCEQHLNHHHRGDAVPFRVSPPSAIVTRRKAFASTLLGGFAAVSTFAAGLQVGGTAAAAAAAEEDVAVTVGSSLPPPSYETRDRRGNKDALIREDYWYMTGNTPPRRLDAPLKGDDVQFNAFGSCDSKVKGDSNEATNNPCTYVSLKQRIPAYSKYGNSIEYGGKEMRALGKLLKQRVATKNPSSSDDESLWLEAQAMLETPSDTRVPPPIVDAELKMILLATALLTSPNFPLPSRELLVARYYANECHFASVEMREAVRQRDAVRAVDAWEYGRDCWNSYFQVVNRSITTKVGDKFQPIPLD